MESSMWFGRVARGGNCPMTSHPGSRSITIFGGSRGTARGTGFMIGSEPEFGGKPESNPRPASAFSTASPSRRLKKGGSGIRRGQESPWPQASCDRRHAGTDRGVGSSSREYPGPRRGQAPHSETGYAVSPTAINLRGRRLCGQVRRLDQWLVLPLCRDRETPRDERFCRVASSDGSWSAPSRGSASTADCPKTTRHCRNAVNA